MNRFWTLVIMLGLTLAPAVAQAGGNSHGKKHGKKHRGKKHGKKHRGKKHGKKHHGKKHHGKKHGKKHRRKAHVDRLKRMFKHLDANGDGAIDATEAAKAPGKFDPMKADADGDGLVTPDELRKHILLKTAGRHFDRLDKNGDGVLDATEIGNSRASKKLRSMDSDGDGTVTRAEFDAAVLARTAARKAVRDAFRNADANGDRSLDSSEWPAGAPASFADVDANGDGKVTGREVHKYKQKNGTWPL